MSANLPELPTGWHPPLLLQRAILRLKGWSTSLPRRHRYINALYGFHHAILRGYS